MTIAGIIISTGNCRGIMCVTLVYTGPSLGVAGKSGENHSWGEGKRGGNCGTPRRAPAVSAGARQRHQNQRDTKRNRKVESGAVHLITGAVFRDEEQMKRQ